MAPAPPTLAYEPNKRRPLSILIIAALLVTLCITLWIWGTSKYLNNQEEATALPVVLTSTATKNQAEILLPVETSISDNNLASTPEPPEVRAARINQTAVIVAALIGLIAACITAYATIRAAAQKSKHY